MNEQWEPKPPAPAPTFEVSLGNMRLSAPFRFGKLDIWSYLDYVRASGVYDVVSGRMLDHFLYPLGGLDYGLPPGWTATVSPEGPAPADTVERVRLIRQSILAMVAHEVDEWLRVNGKRVHNPHPEQRTGEQFWLPTGERVRV